MFAKFHGRRHCACASRASDPLRTLAGRPAEAGGLSAVRFGRWQALAVPHPSVSALKRRPFRGLMRTIAIPEFIRPPSSLPLMLDMPIMSFRWTTTGGRGGLGRCHGYEHAEAILCIRSTLLDLHRRGGKQGCEA